MNQELEMQILILHLSMYILIDFIMKKGRFILLMAGLIFVTGNVSCNLSHQRGTHTVNEEKKNKKERENFSTDDSIINTTTKRKPCKLHSVIKHIKFKRTAIELNNEALKKIEFIARPLTHQDSLKLREAEALLTQAISIDTTYYLAYANMVIVQLRLGMPKEALKTLNRITSLVPDYAEGFSLAGFIYERMGNMDSADLKYRESIVAYNSRIKKTNNIDDMVNRDFILSLINKEKGLEKINNLIKQFPQDKMIKIWKQELFDNFNRKDFINNQTY